MNILASDGWIFLIRFCFLHWFISCINLDLFAVIFMAFVLIVAITHCGKHLHKSIHAQLWIKHIIYATWYAMNLFIDDYILSHDIPGTNNNKTNRNDRTARITTTPEMTWISCCVYICFSTDIVITIIFIIAFVL